MESEITRLKLQIKKSSDLLSNDRFIFNAPLDKQKLEKKKLSDFKSILQSTIKSIVIGLINKYKLDDTHIKWEIQYIRELDCQFEYASKEWFDYIYNPEYTIEEEESLLNYLDNFYKEYADRKRKSRQI